MRHWHTDVCGVLRSGTGQRDAGAADHYEPCGRLTRADRRSRSSRSGLADLRQTGSMGVRVPIEPALLAWAIDRSRVPRDRLEKRFPKMGAWESGASSPTLKQAEDFASATHTPIGMLLLPEPPVETIPLPDFRTIRDTPLGRPSADLLDTIYMCEQRQEWYRDHVRIEGGDLVAFIGTAHGLGVLIMQRFGLGVTVRS